jgi:dethiobiotin synthase
LTQTLLPGTRRGLFVTGTDTGIGKTLVCALLFSALREAREPAGYFKPVQTGRSSDAVQVARLVGLRRKDLPPSVYSLARPASPDRAAESEGVEIRMEAIRDGWSRLPDGFWLVEGAGGLLVPLRERRTMRDLIAFLNLPALIVASTRLGTINHTLLTLESARAAGLAVAGIVLNGRHDPGLAEVLGRFDAAPVVAEVPPLPRLSAKTVARRAKEIFPLQTIRRLFGLVDGDPRALVDEDAR